MKLDKLDTDKIADQIIEEVSQIYKNNYKKGKRNNADPYVIFSLSKREFLVINGTQKEDQNDWRFRNVNRYLLPTPGQVMVLPPYWTWALVMDEPEDVGKQAIKRRLDDFLETLKKFKEDD